MKELDEIDNAIQQGINDMPGCSIRDAIRPFLLERSESVLRTRVRSLELWKLIITIRTKREVRCFPVNKNVKCQMLPASSGATKIQHPIQEVKNYVFSNSI
jgi:predicted transcriptional regulator